MNTNTNDTPQPASATRPDCAPPIGSEEAAWEAAQRSNPQFVRMQDGHPVMRCSECEREHWTGSEGITTSDGKELCISCQCDLRDLYDDDWNLLPNA